MAFGARPEGYLLNEMDDMTVYDRQKVFMKNEARSCSMDNYRFMLKLNI